MTKIKVMNKQKTAYKNVNTQLKAKIKHWLNDWDKTQPKNVIIDDDTFEGGAYYLLKEILNESKERERDIIGFFKLVIEGVRGEYEKGWSHRDDAKDIKSLKQIITSMR